MELNTNTQAILLLTAHFTQKETKSERPLSPSEWGRFAEWLKIHEIQPKDLMSSDISDLLDGWMDKSISFQRIDQLLNRGMAMSMALEKWSRAGIWILTRSDAEYPKKLKNRLRKNSPPVFFGAGNRKLLNTLCLAVVGSRHANDNELIYTQRIGQISAEQGYSIVSGGARGVDENAMLGALKAQGTAVGILADRLLQSCTSKKYRDYLSKGDFVLISPYNPEAGFNPGNAMGRNKYIYCMAEAAIVIRSDRSGGTWNGAIENIKNKWIPLWVSQNQDPKTGNATLVKKGGAWLREENPEDINISELFKDKKSQVLGKQQSFLDSTS
jgi:predicted Rossmann fold nucleotide-binding protein DprA/Smf involved in DNA uptake